MLGNNFPCYRVSSRVDVAVIFTEINRFRDTAKIHTGCWTTQRGYERRNKLIQEVRLSSCILNDLLLTGRITEIQFPGQNRLASSNSQAL